MQSNFNRAKRQPAIRILAQEYSESTLKQQGSGEFDPAWFKKMNWGPYFEYTFQVDGDYKPGDAMHYDFFTTFDGLMISLVSFLKSSISNNSLFLLSRLSMDSTCKDNNKFFSQPKNFPNTFTYLYVGRLIPTKNIDILCQIFMQKFLDKDAKLVIVGSCNNLDSYKQKYMHDKIKFLGAIYDDKLINQYHAASVFVFPSTDESWGLVIN